MVGLSESEEHESAPPECQRKCAYVAAGKGFQGSAFMASKYYFSAAGKSPLANQRKFAN